MEEIVKKLSPADAISPRSSGGQPSEATPPGPEMRVHAEAIVRQQKRAVVNGNGIPYEIYCDEGPRLGGDDTAPPPLSYFSAAIAF